MRVRRTITLRSTAILVQYASVPVVPHHCCCAVALAVGGAADFGHEDQPHANVDGVSLRIEERRTDEKEHEREEKIKVDSVLMY